MNVPCKKSTNESEGKPDQKFDAAFRISFQNYKVRVFSKNQAENSIYFSLEEGRLKM
jgi:hypothetical protein